MFPALLIAVAAIGQTECGEANGAMAAAAAGFDSLVRGHLPAAITCLELAEGLEPNSPLIARDLAAALTRASRFEEALKRIDHAILLGDSDPEARALRATILASLNQTREALQDVEAIQTRDGDLIGAALLDAGSAQRAADTGEHGSDGAAMRSLVLAAYAGAIGAPGAASLLAEDADDAARNAEHSQLRSAAQLLRERLQRAASIVTGARVRASIDHANNPYYLSERPALRANAVRMAMTGEISLSTPIGTARFDAALRLDQHLMLLDRDVFSELDFTAFGLAMSIEVPISAKPNAVLLGLRGRASDAFGDLFGVHWGSAIEGGPYLLLPLGPRFAMEMTVTGIAVDYIDRSPPDNLISSQNRDVVGQRAGLSLLIAGELLDGRIDGMFVRDDALGDAFDGVGGIAAGRVRAHPGGGIVLSTGVAINARSFGPVGDLAIIGPAATRTEVRTVVEVAAEIPITEEIRLIIQDVWIQNTARRLHDYTQNVLSVGAEARW